MPHRPFPATITAASAALLLLSIHHPAVYAQKAAAATAAPTFLEQVDAHFAAWDRDHDGTLTTAELDAAVADPKITGSEAAAVVALKRAARNKRYKLPPLTSAAIHDLVGEAGKASTASSAAADGPGEGDPPPSRSGAPNLTSMYAGALAKITRSGGRNATLFAGGLPKPVVRQGKMGDCFCLAPLGAMLHRDPQQVVALFERQPDGAYKVRLGKRAVFVTPPTDAEIAIGAGAADGEMWVNLYEKAVGTARVEDATAAGKPVVAPLDAASRGGSAGTMLSDLTGHEITRFSCRFAKDKKTTPAEREAKLTEMRAQLEAAFREKRLVTCGTTKPTTPGITPNHAYAVLGYDRATDTIRLWNPHGSDFTPRGTAGPKYGYPRKAGVFALPLPEFVDQFAGLAFEVLPGTASTASSNVLPAADAAVDSAVTTPLAFLGFTPGDDRKLANYKQSSAYFRKIAAQTGRMRLFEIGKSAEGETMLLAAISSPENLAKLDRLKEIAKTLADGRVPEAEAQALAREGRAMVWIDGGLHATEVGCAQHAINLGYDLVAREDDEYKRIRERCVVLLVPTLNPDGQNLVADWFHKNLGTPQEGTPLPVLYQKYSGHDNNRDWYMLNLPETRVITRQLYHEWLPQVVYNHHQAGNMFPERMFVPPYDGPLNPNIPGLAVREVNAAGTAMQTRLAQEGRTGVISLDTYTAWWDGGMRSTPFFHNVVGILTEVAHPSPYPGEYKIPASQQEPTLWYHDPYKGGNWHFADTVAYMNAGSMGLLNWAADRADDIQLNRWRMASAAIARGNKEAPYGFIVPLDSVSQRDPNTAALLLERVRLGGLEVRKATKFFRYGGTEYPEGTAVLLAAQANRPYLIDLFTPQDHPTVRQGPDGPPIPPYDIAGWTLTLQMGVTTTPMAQAPSAEVLAALGSPVAETISAPVLPPAPAVPSGGAFLLPANRNASFTAVNRLLAAGVPVSRWTTAHTIGGTHWAPGTFVVPARGSAATTAAAENLRLPLAVAPKSELSASAGAIRLRPARVGTYDPYGGAMTQGWTQLILETFEFPHTAITNPDIRTGDLRKKVDALILTSFPSTGERSTTGTTSTASTTTGGVSASERRGGLGTGFLGGPRAKEMAPEIKARVEGIGTAGEENLRRFVEEGGTLIATDAAVARTVELFGLPVRDVTRDTKFYSPGSVFRLLIDPADPLCWGLPREVNVFFDKGAAFESALSFASVSQGGAFALYPDENPLLSGWVIEDQVIRRKAAGVSYRIGRGRVVVYGFDVTFRGQPHMGFPLLFNALYPTEEMQAE